MRQSRLWLLSLDGLVYALLRRIQGAAFLRLKGILDMERRVSLPDSLSRVRSWKSSGLAILLILIFEAFNTGRAGPFHSFYDSVKQPERPVSSRSFLGEPASSESDPE